LYFDNQNDASEDRELAFKREAYSVKSIDDLTEQQKESTAEDVFNFLRSGKGSSSTSMYNIDDKYSTEDALKIMQVRFQLWLNKYRKFEPITVATDINQKAVAAIREYSNELKGVEVVTGSYRKYNESESFAHILGYTGLINNTELKEYNKEKDNNNEKDDKNDDKNDDKKDGSVGEYSATDQVGKMGLEKTLEKYLHGKKGSKTITLNSSGQIEKIDNVIEPVAGNDVYLTIDAELQNEVYRLLEKEVADLLVSKIVNTKETPGFSNVKDKRVPIYDVYYAMIDNNLVNIEHLQEDDAKECESRIYSKYIDSRGKSLDRVIDALKKENAKAGEDLEDSIQDYLDRVYHILVEKGVLLKSNISKDDQTYKDYCDEKISLCEFLQYAISKENWIDLEKIAKDSNINTDEKYLSTDEIYKGLLTYIKKYAVDDKIFNKYIYKELIYDDEISPSDICGAMIEQGTMKDKSDYDSLKNHSLDISSYVRSKIKSCDIPPGRLGLDPCSGSVVITDYETGEVRAMVSYPSYDNNKLANVIDPKYYNSLVDGTSYSLVNRATQTKSAPGSTFKPLMSAAGMQEGVITPSSTIYDEYQFTKIPGAAPKCHRVGGHGALNVEGAIEQSCNYFFYEVGYRLGSKDGNGYDSDRGLGYIKKYAEKFGLAEKSGVEIEEVSPQVSDQDAVRSSIGQGSNAYTPSQISRYATTLANGGTCYPLTLVKEAKGLDNKVVLDTRKERQKEVKDGKIKKVELDDSTWAAIKNGMKRSASVNAQGGWPLNVYGKTGTAQESKKRPDHGLFISYSDPQGDLPGISVTTVINFGYGSENAVTLAKKVYDYYVNPKND